MLGPRILPCDRCDQSYFSDCGARRGDIDRRTPAHRAVIKQSSFGLLYLLTGLAGGEMSTRTVKQTSSSPFLGTTPERPVRKVNEVLCRAPGDRVVPPLQVPAPHGEKVFVMGTPPLPKRLGQTTSWQGPNAAPSYPTPRDSLLLRNLISPAAAACKTM